MPEIEKEYIQLRKNIIDAELSRLMTEKDQAQWALDEMYAQWEELSAGLED